MSLGPFAQATLAGCSGCGIVLILLLVVGLGVRVYDRARGRQPVETGWFENGQLENGNWEMEDWEMGEHIAEHSAPESTEAPGGDDPGATRGEELDQGVTVPEQPSGEPVVPEDGVPVVEVPEGYVPEQPATRGVREPVPEPPQDPSGGSSGDSVTIG